MKNTENKKEKLADFATLCAWLITCVTMAFIAHAQFGQDFRGYYAAAKVLLAGGNPYDYHQVAPILMETTGRIGNNPFYYPLWFGWLAAPLSLLPYQAARAVWMVINLFLWIVGLIRLRNLLDWPRKGWQTWGMNLLATFIFAWSTWKFEQTGILLFAITVETVIAYRKRR
ncbi:MAG TPA: glycosyltransferase family 87 protein, partial [Anaerolineales bacterium]|nr:glycosyltransferase family 87 protein [Anaerolineales bacterium]